jgi:hypothetical protein
MVPLQDIRPDYFRAKSLMEMSNIILERLNEIDIFKYPSLSLIDYYTSIHMKMEAFSIAKGIKSRGEGSHASLIAYFCRETPIKDHRLLNELRELRNRISYEGFFIRKDYLKRKLTKIRMIIKVMDTVIIGNLP